MTRMQRQIEERNTKSVLENLALFNAVSKALATNALEPSGIPLGGMVTAPELGNDIGKMMQEVLSSFVDDTVWTTTNGELVRGREAIVADLVQTFQTFPGIQIELPVEALATHGNQVALLYFMAGDRTNGFMGQRPVEKQYKFLTSAFVKFNEEGKRTETLLLWNPLVVYFVLGFPTFAVTGTPGTTTTPCQPVASYGGGPERPTVATARGSSSGWRDWTPEPMSASAESGGAETLSDLLMGALQLPLSALVKSAEAVFGQEGTRTHRGPRDGDRTQTRQMGSSWGG